MECELNVWLSLEIVALHVLSFGRLVKAVAVKMPLSIQIYYSHSVGINCA